jgi:hypothetical protein
VQHRSLWPAVPPSADADAPERRFDGHAWGNIDAPPAASSVSNTGVVLLSGTDPAKGMLLVSIDSLDGHLDLGKWTAAGGWASAMQIPAPSSNVRLSLAGSGCGSIRPTIFWTERASAAQPGVYSVMGADLASLL